jgi:NADPH:quinone reductase-like Zn-dependent oxidoreductase
LRFPRRADVEAFTRGQDSFDVLRGAHVIGTARAEKHAFLRDLGADELIDYTEVDFTTVIRDVDVVFDLVGDGYAARSLDTLKPGGLLIDAVGGEQELTVPEVEACGLRFARFYVSPSGKDLISELVEAGALRVLLDQVLPLEQAAKAHELSETNRVSGKIVLATLTKEP